MDPASEPAGGLERQVAVGERGRQLLGRGVDDLRAQPGQQAADPVAVELGMQPLAVTNTINDWDTQDLTTLEENLRAAIRPGEVVLAHDGGGDRTNTVAAVKTVVTERLAAGWTFTLPVGGTAPRPDR